MNRLIYLTALLLAVSFLMVLVAVTLFYGFHLLAYALGVSLSWSVVESFKRFAGETV